MTSEYFSVYMTWVRMHLHLIHSLFLFCHRMKFAFMLHDEESTGSITHRELVKILRSNHLAKTEAEVQRKAETIIAQCDKRNDGIITFDEFVVVSKKFPNILFPSVQTR